MEPGRPVRCLLHIRDANVKRPPLGVCPNLWPTNGYEWSIEEMWRVSDWVEWLIFIALFFMLAYTVLVTARFFQRYVWAWRKSSAVELGSAPPSQRCDENLVAELRRAVANPKSIASAAPFLGLAGTCYGILAMFFRGYAVSRTSFISDISLEISATPVATAAGLLVAISAAISYNVLRMRLEKLERSRSNVLLGAAAGSFQVAQRLPLRMRFSGLPPFALIGAPVLAILLPMLMLESPEIPVGLPVHLLRISASDHDFPPIIIRVIRVGSGDSSVVFVNSKATPWDELGKAIRSQLELRPRWIVYVEGADEYDWGSVLKAIDVVRGLHSEVILLTASPSIDSGYAPEPKLRDKSRMK